ncbi:hypothetical protein NIES4106_30550 [Fischerella sp. NIES-4106]|nr:hypothetical protein NIES4106_30550 [Fischerella sp. NIES-4106]
MILQANVVLEASISRYRTTKMLPKNFYLSINTKTSIVGLILNAEQLEASKLSRRKSYEHKALSLNLLVIFITLLEIII